PSAGPSVVAARLLDVRTIEEGEEVEDSESRTERVDPGPLRVREVLVDPVVAEVEVSSRDLVLEAHQVPVDGLDLLDLLFDRDVAELSLLRDGPVHRDRVLLREGDLRFPARRLCDLDRVIDNRATVRLREGVRCGESKRTVREDSDADARVVPDIQRVKDSVPQDEILRFLSLEARLRIGRPLRSRVVDRKTHKVHFPVQDRAPKD